MSSFDAPVPVAVKVTSRGALIRLLDASMEVVAERCDHLETSLEAGLYSVEAQVGTAVSRESFIVRGGKPIELKISVHPESAAPVFGSPGHNVRHARLAAALTELTGSLGHGRSEDASAALVVIVRNLSPRSEENLASSAKAREPNAVDEFDAPISSVTRGGSTAAGRSARSSPMVSPPPSGSHFERRDDVQGWVYAMSEGGYGLTWKAGWEQSLWLVKGMQTVVFGACVGGRMVHELTSIHYRPLGERWHSDERTRDVEKALAWLRAMPGTGPDSCETMRKPQDPAAALYALHRQAQAFMPKGRRSRLSDVGSDWATTVDRVATQLPGHPDVSALQTLARRVVGLQSGEVDAHIPNTSTSAILAQSASTWPPMLSAAMDLLMREEQEGLTRIAAGSETDLASGARLSTGPWLLWKDPSEPTARVPLRRRRRPRRKLAGRPHRPSAADSLHYALTPVGPSPEIDVEDLDDVARESVHVARVRAFVEALASTREVPARRALLTSEMTVDAVAGRLGMSKARVEDALRVLRYTPSP